MSIASEITSIGENLKKDYQSIANLGADLTNVDKNIENIAELLDGVYNNLPKTEYQEGTEVNLGKTIKGKLDYDNGVVGYGDTEQDSTQGYNIVGLQDSSGSINGITYKVENGVVTLNGTATSTTENYNISKIISNGDINFNTSTHSIKWYYEGTLPQGTARGYIGITEYYYNYLVMLTGETSPHNMVIHNGDNIRIRFEQGITFNNFKIKLMINEGTTIKDYEQYSGGYASPSPNWEQEVKCVTGNQDVVVKDGDNNTIVTYQLSLGDKELYDECTIVGSPDNWKFVDNFIRINCTSNMTWYKSSTTAVDKYYTRTPYDFDSSVTGESIGNKCTHFIFKNNASVVGQWDYNQNNDKLALFFCFATYNTSSIDSFKTWLDSVNMSCVVKVPTPIETPITDTTLISQLNAWYNAHSLNGTTIITSNGNLPMIIKVRGLKGE